MKKFLVTALALTVFSVSGYTSEELPQVEQFERVAANPVRIIEEIQPIENEKYIVADEKFSNLQIDEIDKPVYDKYSITERDQRGLTNCAVP